MAWHEFVCTHCEKKVAVKPEAIGAAAACSHCGSRMTVPTAEQDQAFRKTLLRRREEEAEARRRKVAMENAARERQREEEQRRREDAERAARERQRAEAEQREKEEQRRATEEARLFAEGEGREREEARQRAQEPIEDRLQREREQAGQRQVCGKRKEESLCRNLIDRGSDSTTSTLAGLGVLFLVGGLLCAAYFFFVFDTSVAVPTTKIFGHEIGGGRINNLGLMNDRTNGIIIGIGLAVTGAIFLAVSDNRESK